MARWTWCWLAAAVLGLAGGFCLPPVWADEAAADKAQAELRTREEEYELLSALVDTLDEVQRNYVKDISRRELIEAAIQGVLQKLDPYSNYIAPEDLSKFRTSVENQFGGIGIQIRVVAGQLLIRSPLVDTPAYRAGLLAGDHITAIDGQPTQGVSADEAVRRLKGEVGTSVKLTVVHPGAKEPISVDVTRELIHMETVLGDRRQDSDAWDFMLDHQHKIGYIRITSFSRDTADELRTALEQLKAEGMRGLVVDLRFNPGGLLSSAIEVSDLFISEGRIVSTEGRNSEPRSWDAKAEGTFEGFPMAVLVNRYSASASEIVAACLQDHHRAVVIGERTWGKGSVQNVIQLEGGKSALKLTTASYHRPSGKNIHRFPDATEADEWGVKPDEGYDLRLENRDLNRLIAYRSERDILHSHFAQKAKAEQEKSAGQKPRDDKSAGEEKKPSGERTQSDAPAAPADDKPADEPKADDKPPADGPPSEAAPSGDQPPADEVPADKKPADTKPADKPAEGESKPSTTEDPHAEIDELQVPADYVDRQLAKAVEYLLGQLKKR